MANVNNLKRGMGIKVDGVIYTVVQFQHVKPGKGGAFVRTKLKNAKTGAVVERTFRGGENVEDAFLEEKAMEYLYKEGHNYVFMDTNTYEQVYLDESKVGEIKDFLKENMEVKLECHENEILDIVVPQYMEFKVIETEPGFKGDTASGNVLKPAKIETGAIVKVPLFVNEGDMIQINTETREYMRRV